MDETSGAIFARRMRQERVVAGLTQADVAQRLVDLGVAIDASAITRIERHNRVVKLDEAVAIAEVIDVPLMSLLDPEAGEDGRLAELEREYQVARWEASQAELHYRSSQRAVDDLAVEIAALRTSRKA